MFDKYVVGKDGAIVSKYNGRVLAVHVDKKGYHRVNIHCEAGKKTYLLHRVVALVHLPNPGNLPQINHLDGDKANNSVDNLEWTTGRENVAHSVRTGLVKRGDKRPNAKLSDEMVHEIRRLRECEGLTLGALGEMFNLSDAGIHKVCTRLTYTHI